LLVAALATAAGVLVLTGDDDGDNAERSPQTVAPASPPTPQSRPEARNRPSPRGRGGARRQVQQAVEESEPARLDPSQRRAAEVARAYVAAVDERDGGRACGLFVPGALAKVDFPRDRGTCARSLSASIGYRDPRGFPVYESSRIARIPAVAIDGSGARVTATTVTRFAYHREPSVEEDVIYLRKQGGSWLIAKPSVTLYRAIGVGNIPAKVLAPP